MTAFTRFADVLTALHWSIGGADAGDADAMCNLGVLLIERGGDRDLVQAEQWYRRAADAGHATAMYNLGLLLQQRGGAGDLA